MSGFITAIDGGGSGCRGCVETKTGALFVATSHRPANIQSDFSAAVAALNDLIAQLAQAAQTTEHALKSGKIQLGLAGVLDNSHAERTARAMGLRMNQISDDQTTTLRGALGRKDGVLAAIGTGSFIAIQQNGVQKFIGGHGAVLGDQASGAWLGRMAMQQALLIWDGLAPTSTLGQRLLDHFDNANAMIAFAAAANPAGFAQFAPWVLDAARGGDTAAQSLLSQAANYIATAADHLAKAGDLPLCLTGGIGPHLGEYLPPYWQSRLNPAQGSALDGAMAMARAQSLPPAPARGHQPQADFALKTEQLFDGRALRGPCVLTVKDGKVAQIYAPEDAPATSSAKPIKGLLCPGFVDLQVNGGAGVMIDEDLKLDKLDALCTAHARLGALHILPTLITDRPAVQSHVANVVEQGIEQALPILGIHFEGPHLDPNQAGAHDPKLIRPMTDHDLNFYIKLRKTLPSVMITIAPENCSLDQLRALIEAGIVVALGHSNTDFATAETYFQAGACATTHLFNAMSGLSHRAPGLVGAALNSTAPVGIIADLQHVTAPALQLALKAKMYRGEVYAVSDCMAVAGTYATEFTLNTRKILRDKGRLTLQDGTLAGADLDLQQALRNLCHNMNVPLLHALRMLTQTPAQVLNRDDVGHIRIGAPANLLQLSTDLQLRQIWQNGHEI